MKQKLTSIMSGIVLMYNTLGCGPDTVNNHNYYGNPQISPSGSDGNYSCQDAENVDFACVQKDHRGGSSNIAEKCEQYDWFTQDCINCVVSAPCELEFDEEDQEMTLITPFAHCVYAGICKKPN